MNLGEVAAIVAASSSAFTAIAAIVSRRKIQEIHVLVNSKTELLKKEIADLTVRLHESESKNESI